MLSAGYKQWVCSVLDREEASLAVPAVALVHEIPCQSTLTIQLIQARHQVEPLLLIPRRGTESHDRELPLLVGVPLAEREKVFDLGWLEAEAEDVVGGLLGGHTLTIDVDEAELHVHLAVAREREIRSSEFFAVGSLVVAASEDHLLERLAVVHSDPVDRVLPQEALESGTIVRVDERKLLLGGKLLDESRNRRERRLLMARRKIGFPTFFLIIELK